MQKNLLTLNNIGRLPIRSSNCCKKLFDDMEENEEKMRKIQKKQK